MTQLTNLSPSSSYGDLLTTTNGGNGLSNVLQAVQDGFGNNSPITVATNAVNFNRTGGSTFQLDGIALTAVSSTINSICNLNSFNYAGNTLALQLNLLAADPVISNGAVYYNTALNQIRACVNGVWGPI